MRHTEGGAVQVDQGGSQGVGLSHRGGSVLRGACDTLSPHGSTLRARSPGMRPGADRNCVCVSVQVFRGWTKRQGGRRGLTHRVSQELGSVPVRALHKLVCLFPGLSV